MSHAGRSSSQKQRAHARRLSHAPSSDWRHSVIQREKESNLQFPAKKIDPGGILHVLHGVVDGETSCHGASRAVDVDVNRLLVALGLQEQELSNHDACHLICDLFEDESIEKKVLKPNRSIGNQKMKKPKSITGPIKQMIRSLSNLE